MAETTMASGVFRLKGRQLYGESISKGRVHNVQEIADRSGITYPTAHRWINKSGDLQGVDFANLAGFLIDGLGLLPSELAEMRFGDVFEFIPNASSSVPE